MNRFRTKTMVFSTALAMLMAFLPLAQAGEVIDRIVATVFSMRRRRKRLSGLPRRGSNIRRQRLTRAGNPFWPDLGCRNEM